MFAIKYYDIDVKLAKESLCLLLERCAIITDSTVLEPQLQEDKTSSNSNTRRDLTTTGKGTAAYPV